MRENKVNTRLLHACVVLVALYMAAELVTPFVSNAIEHYSTVPALREKAEIHE